MVLDRKGDPSAAFLDRDRTVEPKNKTEPKRNPNAHHFAQTQENN